MFKVCGDPPVLQGITFEEKTRQSQDAYYIGDVLQAKCDIFGEEVVADHDGKIECLATGSWTPRHPACRSLYCYDNTKNSCSLCILCELIQDFKWLFIIS